MTDCAGVRNGLPEAGDVRKGFDTFDTNDPVGVTARVSRVLLLEGITTRGYKGVYR